MNFLTPSILFALAAISIPVLIHLLTRSKSKTIPFSTLAFLQELAHQNIRRLKLRQLLLLIIRTLIVLLLVLTFARPALKSNSLKPNSKTSAVIICDNSFSMNSFHDGQTLFFSAKQIASSVSDMMSPGDEIFFITATDTVSENNRRAFHDFSAFKKQIMNCELDYRTTDLSASIHFAQKLLCKSQNLNREIYIVSDFQKIAFHADVTLDCTVKLFAIPVMQKNIFNLNISQVESKNTILEKGKIVEISANFSNHSSQSAGNRLAQIVVNDRKVAQTLINLNAGSEQSESFKYVLNETGFEAGYVLLEDDDLREDNKRFFAFYVPEQIHVALCGGQEKDTEFVGMALMPGATSSRFLVDKMSFEKLRYSSLDAFDVILLINVQNFDKNLAEKLRTFIDSGGGLLATIGRMSDLESYNSYLAQSLELPKVIQVLDTPQSYFSLGKTDLSHPLFYGIFETDQAIFAKPQFRFAVKIEDESTTDRIMQFSTGDPFLFEKKFASGSILVFTSNFNTEESDLPHRTIFAPLITQSINYLASVGFSQGQDFAIGQELKYKLESRSAGALLKIKRPDGRMDQIRPKIARDGLWIHYSFTNIPGIYTLEDTGGILYQWVVNVDPVESDPARIASSDLKDKYGMTIVEHPDHLAEEIRSSRYGYELWKILIVTTLILLIIEMLLFREKGEVPTELKLSERMNS